MNDAADVPRLLVCWFSHTGQTEGVARALLTPLESDGAASVTWHRIEPVHPLPFPFRRRTFFGLMPEIVLEEPMALHPVTTFSPSDRFDLVVLASPVWFLTPSRPMSSFLKTPEAAVIDDTPVVIVMTCRSLWSVAADRLAELVEGLGGRPVGTLVATGPPGDITSALATNRWFFRGKKQGRFLPEAGVPADVIAGAARWAPDVLAAARGQRDRFVGATPLVSASHLAQQAGGQRLFATWAKRIQASGPEGSGARSREVLRFVGLISTLEVRGYWAQGRHTVRKWIHGPDRHHDPGHPNGDVSHG